MDNCEFSAPCNLTRRAQIPFLHLEQIVPDEQLAFRFHKLRLAIVEVDTLQPLIDMQLPSFTVFVETIPIEHAISRVAVLLDFHQQIARADCMEAAGW